MNRIINNSRAFFSNNSAVMTLTALTIGVVTATTLLLASAPKASAASCNPKDAAPETNIIYCGLSGSTDNDLATQFKSYYTSSTDGYERDIALITNSAYKATNGHDINTGSNPLLSGTWKIGTSYHDGTIKVGDTLVGQGAWIASRCPPTDDPVHCQPLSRYPTLVGNVKINDATWSFGGDNAPKQALIHFDANGTADLAMWTQCGNMLVFKPVPPAPKSLKCVNLTPSVSSSNPLFYTFTANAEAQNVSVSSYSFRFSGNSQVTTGTSNSITHLYTATEIQHGFSVVAVINSDQLPNVDIGGNETVNSPQICTYAFGGQLVCDSLNSTVDYQNGSYVYTFTAVINNPQATNAKYDIIYGDNGTTVETHFESATATEAIFKHPYSQLDTDAKYTAQFVLNDVPQTGECQKTITIPGHNTLACRQITPVYVGSDNISTTYKFIADTSDNSKVSSYTFKFDDGTSLPQTSDNTVTKRYNNIDVAQVHTYTTSFTAQPFDSHTVINLTDACKTSFTTTPKPDILSHAGPSGIVSLVGSTTVLGTAVRYIMLRRKASL